MKRATAIVLLLTVLGALSAAAVAADEVTAVVIPAGSSHRIDSLEALASIYRRKKQYWPDGQAVEPINLPAADPRRRRFSQAVLGLTPDQLDAYWNELYFHGVLPPKVLQSAEAVLRFVSMTPGGVGYVPWCSVDSRVAVALVLDADGAVPERPPAASCKREPPGR